MKNTIYTILSLLMSPLVFGQVGINTQNPQGVFNIDGLKDNPVTGSAHTPTEQLNDFTVLENGYVGIGTITPSQKLEIQTGGTAAAPVTGFKLVDGNQNNNLVLTSDANGVGTWLPVSTTIKSGGFTTNSNNLPFAPTGWTQTGGFISLTPGIWKVDLIELIKGLNANGYLLSADDYCWIRFSLADSDLAASPSLDFINIDTSGNVVTGSEQYVATGFSGPKLDGTGNNDKYAVAQGSFIIRNDTTAAKTYYIISQIYKATNTLTTNEFYFEQVGSSTWGENRITAIRVNP